MNSQLLQVILWKKGVIYMTYALVLLGALTIGALYETHKLFISEN